MDIQDRLEIADSGREQCSSCGKCIPKDIQRVSFPYSSSYGSSAAKRLCGLCIYKLAKALNLKQIKLWEEKLIEREI